MARSGSRRGVYFEVHECSGRPAAGTVILSAGLGGSASFWPPQLAALTARFRVVLYDHRSAGRSDRALPKLDRPYAVEDMADDIAELMAGLGIASASHVGHAAGGLAGLSLAVRQPERVDKLVVVNGWSRPDPHIARCFATRICLLRHGGPTAYIQAQPLFLYPADWISAHDARLVEEAAHQVAGFPDPSVMLARIGALLAFDIDARLSEIAAPVLVSASADDMLVPASCSRRLAAGLRNARLDMAPWGGHGFTVTAPEGFNRSLVAFLAAEAPVL